MAKAGFSKNELERLINDAVELLLKTCGSKEK